MAQHKKRPQITETPIRTGLILSLSNIITRPLCLVKYGRSFVVEFLLYKLRTWQIRTGLRSQTTSAIITNY